MKIGKTFVSGILAGISIAIGGLVFLSVENRVIGAALFTVGLFSVCSFGVYLLHPLFLDIVRSRHWDLTRYSAVWLYPLCYLCFLLGPMALTWVMLKIPGLRKLVS